MNVSTAMNNAPIVGDGVLNDSLSNVTSSVTVKSSLTINIILFLLVVITCVMAYNYWNMYRSIPSANKRCTEERFINENNHRELYNSNEAGPTVQSALDRVSNYTEGGMSPELRKHYDDHLRAKVQAEKQVQEQAQVDTVVQIQRPLDIQHLSQQRQQRQKNNDSALSHTPEQSKNKGTQIVMSGSPRPMVMPEVKLIIYHMEGCGHCSDIMHVKRENNKTKFEHLQEIFSRIPNVRVLDYQYGRDKEAEKFNAFPVIMIVSNGREVEYRGPREVKDITGAVVQMLTMNYVKK